MQKPEQFLLAASLSPDLPGSFSYRPVLLCLALAIFFFKGNISLLSWLVLDLNIQIPASVSRCWVYRLVTPRPISSYITGKF